MSNSMQPTTQTEVYVLGCDFIAEVITVNMSGGSLRTLNLYRSGENNRKIMPHKSYSTNPKDDADAKADIGSFLTDIKRCEQIWNRFMDVTPKQPLDYPRRPNRSKIVSSVLSKSKE